MRRIATVIAPYEPFLGGGHQARASLGANQSSEGKLGKVKPIHLPVGLAFGLLVWLFTHVPDRVGQVLAYIGVGGVIAALIWAYRKAAALERKSEPRDHGTR
jgi:hypothetical protein